MSSCITNIIKKMVNYYINYYTIKLRKNWQNIIQNRLGNTDLTSSLSEVRTIAEISCYWNTYYQLEYNKIWKRHRFKY